ncbi:hypothetical protein Pan14r_32700 [Crateriforma conspicua]|uniref:Uncharacterized protein n=1 Tax=Crateriforma conspicua TaxID=2527996 RepID=A0A5C5Y937_9PLAN|nr:hypothetical protein Pan14r_32700 [Crateriforma conspicua]
MRRYFCRFDANRKTNRQTAPIPPRRKPLTNFLEGHRASRRRGLRINCRKGPKRWHNGPQPPNGIIPPDCLQNPTAIIRPQAARFTEEGPKPGGGAIVKKLILVAIKVSADTKRSSCHRPEFWTAPGGRPILTLFGHAWASGLPPEPRLGFRPPYPLGFGLVFKFRQQPFRAIAAEQFRHRIDQHGRDRSFIRFGNLVQPLVQPFNGILVWLRNFRCFEPGFTASQAVCRRFEPGHPLRPFPAGECRRQGLALALKGKHGVIDGVVNSEKLLEVHDTQHVCDRGIDGCEFDNATRFAKT